MKYRESIKEDLLEYNKLYGELPDTQEELVEYLIRKNKVSMEDIKRMVKEESEIPWITFQLSLKALPYPTPRPRVLKNGVTYVRGAKKHKKLLREYITDANIVCTKTIFKVKTYQLLPKDVNKKEAILFEMGVYQPLIDPDWDNLGKTYSDMVQQILLLNDNIIVKGTVEKYASIKPRVEIEIRYQKYFDSKFNEKRIKRTKSYQTLIEGKGDSI